MGWSHCISRLSRIQFHIERIKEICTEIRDIKEKHKKDKHEEDEHNKTTSPEVKLRTTYKYKVGNKGIHDQCVQDYIYSTNRNYSHQKPHDDTRNSRRAYEGYPTQRLSILTPVRLNNSHASPPSPPADTGFPSSPPVAEMTVSPVDPSRVSWKSSLPLLSLLSVTLQREGTESFEEGEH
jgi:hypothetical protein